MGRLRDPVAWTNASQLLKTVAAAVIAWTLAADVLDIEQPFLAPWAALLTVHATVFRTLRRGVQQVGATVIGVLVASAVGSVLGVGALALGFCVFIALLAGSIRGLRAESTTAAATALVVLTTGAGDDGELLVARLLDTGIGIGVGLLVNLLVWPPLRDRSAAAQVDAIDDRLGELLRDIAGGLRGDDGPATEDWIARAGELERDIDSAWAVVGQARESGRLNPRPAKARRMSAAEGFDEILGRLEQALADTRSMVRTIGLAHAMPADWDPGFRDPWIALLDRAGQAVCGGDPGAVRAVRADLDAFAGELTADALPPGFWHVAGALLVDLRNILDALDVVAEAQPVEVPAPPLTQPRARSRL